MTISFLLYFTPIVFRIVDTSPSIFDLVIALVPSLLIQSLSVAAKKYVSCPETEHEWRHILYATAFTVAGALGIHFDRALEEFPLVIAYAVLGAATLWWFVICHCVENRRLTRVYTHQGDLTVLPLTLVAIATFSSDIPLSVVRAGRSILFFTPVIVAWATLHLIAYNEFSLGRTTTLNSRFDDVVNLSVPVASAHLVLIEMAAPPVVFLVFPFVASFLSQTSFRTSDPVVTRPSWRRRILLLTLLFLPASLVPFLVHFAKERWEDVFLVVVYPGMVFPLLIPLLAGESWALPSSLYVTLLASSYALKEGGRGVHVWDSVLFLAALWGVVYFVYSLV